MLRAVVWEPDPVARRTVVSVLKLAGYELVEQAGSADEALSLSERAKPNVLLFSVPDDAGQWASRLTDTQEHSPATTVVAFADEPALAANVRAAGVSTVLETASIAYLDELHTVLARVAAAATTTVEPDDTPGATEAAEPSPGGGDEWFPLREAAQATGVPLARLRRWCNTGSVPSRKEAGRRLVQLDDVRSRAAADAAEAARDSTPAEAPVDLEPLEPQVPTAPEPEPVASEPQPEPEPEPKPEPEVVVEPTPEPPATEPGPVAPWPRQPRSEPEPLAPLSLAWTEQAPTPAPPRESYDVIPDGDEGRRGRRRR